MAFKQNRKPGTRLDSYTSMQEKGLLNKVKDRITEKREAKAKKKAIASTQEAMATLPQTKEQINKDENAEVQAMYRGYSRGVLPGNEKIRKKTEVSVTKAPDVEKASIMNQPWNAKIQTGDWDPDKREFIKIDNPVDNIITDTGYGPSSNPTFKGRIGLPTGKQLTVSHNTSNIKNKNINLSGDLTLGEAVFRKKPKYDIEGKIKPGTGSFTQKGLGVSGNVMANIAASAPQGKLYAGAGLNITNLASKKNFGSIRPTVKVGADFNLRSLNQMKKEGGVKAGIKKHNITIPGSLEMKHTFNKNVLANASPMTDQGRSTMLKASLGIAGGNEYKGNRWEVGLKSNNVTHLSKEGVQPYFKFTKTLGAKHNKK